MSHTTSHAKLAAGIETAKSHVKVGGIYRHFRTGDDYRVLSIGLCEWDEGPAVIYQRLADANNLTWIRPVYGKDGWLTPALRDGVETARFELVS